MLSFPNTFSLVLLSVSLSLSLSLSLLLNVISTQHVEACTHNNTAIVLASAELLVLIICHCFCHCEKKNTQQHYDALTPFDVLEL